LDLLFKNSDLENFLQNSLWGKKKKLKFKGNSAKVHQYFPLAL